MSSLARRIYAQHTVAEPAAADMVAKLTAVGLLPGFYNKLLQTAAALEAAGGRRDATQRGVAAESIDRRGAADALVRLIRVIRGQASAARFFNPAIAEWADAALQPLLPEIDSQQDAVKTLHGFLVSLRCLTDPTALRLDADIVAQVEAALARYHEEGAQADQESMRVELNATDAAAMADQLEHLFQMLLTMKDLAELRFDVRFDGFGWNELRETVAASIAGTLDAAEPAPPGL